MPITDDLVHGTILGWSVDTGTPAQQVEQALQAYRNRFDVEPQVVLHSAITPVRGADDDAELVTRQTHIDFRDYPVAGKGILQIAVRYADAPKPPLPPFSPPDVLPPPKKKRTEKQESRHQEMVDAGLVEAASVLTIDRIEELVIEAAPALVTAGPVSNGYAQFVRKRR